MCGTLEENVPSKIVAARIVDGKILCKVKWKRKKGEKIAHADTEFTINELQEDHNDLLVNFSKSLSKQ